MIAEEQFDVVDTDDNPTGSLTDKREAHDKGLAHRVVAVHVFQKGKLLLQVHENSDGLLDHTVGGHVSAGESHIDAAKREMREEIGLVAPLEPIATGVFADEVWKGLKVTHIFGVYKAIAPPSWSFKPNDEVNELVVMTIGEVEEKLYNNPKGFTGGFIATFNAYLIKQSLPNAGIAKAAKIKGVTI